MLVINEYKDLPEQASKTHVPIQTRTYGEAWKCGRQRSPAGVKGEGGEKGGNGG